MQKLTKDHAIVAEVTCIEAKSRFYSTFRDQYLRVLAMPPHVRWTATFRVEHVLKGNSCDQTVTLIDARDASPPYDHFSFEAGKSYILGFNSASNKGLKGCAVLGHESGNPAR